MNFNFSDEQIAFQALAKDFAEQEMAPHASEWDEACVFPLETLQKAAKLGFAGLYVRNDIGGSGLSRLDASLIFTELATACVSTSAYLSIHNMVTWLIDTYGSQKQREHWLPSLLSMENTASYCLTEPSSGSDAASLQTRATRKGDEFVLNGSKAFISGGSVSNVYACMVRTGEEGPKGISCILVPKDAKGLSFGKKESKLGWHSQPTTMVFFEDCHVPAENLIGEEGMGFNIALNALNGGRISLAACSLGGAQACFELAKSHMLERKQFKKRLADFQALQFKLADMRTELEAARLMVYQAASKLDVADPETPLYCAMAKRLATDSSFNICNEALQIYGGYGYLRDYPLERHFRDLRVHQILEGTNEIMRVIIARSLLEHQTRSN